jgi:hypothetical protein
MFAMFHERFFRGPVNALLMRSFFATRGAISTRVDP